MKKRLILAALGAVVILAGVATFAANTAQWVNVTAHVEKEIELACVKADATGKYVLDANGCDFGTVFPQEQLQQVVELTLSKSFMVNTQVRASDVSFRALWECKLVDPTKVYDARTNPCREELPATDKLHLDGNIRNYITVETDSWCKETATPDPTVNPAKIHGIWDGTLNKNISGQAKCIYHLKFDVPVCTGEFNPNTEPGVTPKSVDCVLTKTNPDDIQTWDRHADLGDDFKIQVKKISYD
jgi:hypothetical protein